MCARAIRILIRVNVFEKNLYEDITTNETLDCVPKRSFKVKWLETGHINYKN